MKAGFAESGKSEPLSAAATLRVTRGNAFEDAVWTALQAAADSDDSIVCIDATDETPFAPDGPSFRHYINSILHLDEPHDPSYYYKTFYLYQAPFSEVHLGTTGTTRITTSKAYPDILVVSFVEARQTNEGVAPYSVRVTVADVKSSAAGKVSHQAQIAVYCDIIQKNLGEDDGNIEVSDIGEIWLPGEESLYCIEKIELAPVKHSVRRVLAKLEDPRFFENPNWALSASRCSGCPYLGECREEAKGTRRALQEAAPHKGDPGAPLADIEDMWTKDPSFRMENATSLRCTEDTPVPECVVSQREGKVVKKEGADIMAEQCLPQRCDNDIVLSILSGDGVGRAYPMVRAFCIENMATKTSKCIAFDEFDADDVQTFLHTLDSFITSSSSESLQVYVASLQEKFVLQKLLDEVFLHGSQDATNLAMLKRIAGAYAHDSVECIGTHWRKEDRFFAELAQVVPSTASLGDWKRLAKTFPAFDEGVSATATTKKKLTDFVSEQLQREGLPSDPKLALPELARHTQTYPSVICLRQIAAKLFWIPEIGYPVEFHGFSSVDLATEDQLVGCPRETLLQEAEKRVVLAKETLGYLRGAFSGEGCATSVASKCLSFWQSESVFSELLWCKEHEKRTNITDKCDDVSVAKKRILITKTNATTWSLSNTPGLPSTDREDELEAQRTSFIEQVDAFRSGNYFVFWSAPEAAQTLTTQLRRLNKTFSASGPAHSAYKNAKDAGFALGDLICVTEPSSPSGLMDVYGKKYTLKIKDARKDVGKVLLYGSAELSADFVKGMPVGTVLSLYPRNYDANSPKVTVSLMNLSDAFETALPNEPSAFLNTLLTDGPASANTGCGCEDNSYGDERLDKTSTLTASQERAYSHFTHHRIQLVWGPPGTGKTFYLANAIVRWMEAQKTEGEGYKIAVTSVAKDAFTEVIAIVRSIVQTRDASLWRDVDVILQPAHGETEPSSTSTFVVHGLTAWKAEKTAKERYDMIVIDEGSQMPATDATLMVCDVHPSLTTSTFS